jgi:hypothetical protein
LITEVLNYVSHCLTFSYTFFLLFQSLEEFKKLNPQVDLVEGAEIEMTVRGDTLLYKNAVGGVGSLKSRVFCEALCDVYYGKDPVSPTLKESVLAGIPKV